jgi:hypothetical protein
MSDIFHVTGNALSICIGSATRIEAQIFYA